MRLNDYQEFALDTCILSAYSTPYLVTGLAAEAGEVAGKYAKYIRDETPLEEFKKDLKKELGDVLWFVSVLAGYHNISLEEVASANVKKLNSRKERGVLGGSGDNR